MELCLGLHNLRECSKSLEQQGLTLVILPFYTDKILKFCVFKPMRKPIENIRLMSRDLPIRNTLLAVTLFSLLISGLHHSQLGEAVRNWIERPITFRYRGWLSKHPKLSKRVKIFAYDDKTLGYVNNEDLHLNQWSELMAHFGKAKPKAVFIDKIFGTPLGRDQATSFVQRLQGFDFPVVVGSFVSYYDLKFRPVVPLEKAVFDPKQYFPEGTSFPSWLESQPAMVYGPSPEVYPAFRHVGHLLYDGSFFFRPVIRLLEDRLIWGAPFYLSDKRLIHPTSVEVDTGQVPVDEAGRILLNLPDLEQMFQRTYTLSSILQEMGAGDGPRRVNEGDVVVILPAMYTGHSDLAATPLGTIPGGYVMVSLINSILTHQWVRRASWDWTVIPLLGFVGWAVGSVITGWALLIFLPLSLGAALFSMWIFSAYALEIAWFFPGLNLWFCTVSVFLIRLRGIQASASRIRNTLEGVISKTQLKQILQHPEGLALKPRGQVVTVMFVDMVGFSRTVKDMPAHQAFEFLQRVMSRLSGIVHAHGGVVDKSLGDGLLCFFGYEFDGSPPKRSSILSAVECGREMQWDAANAIVAGVGLPLRIGINTTEAFVGDLGGRERIELTIIGSGVNFAQRLEAGCEPYRLLLGADTFSALTESERSSLFLKKRFLKVKHEREIFPAFECDPFASRLSLLEEALAAFRLQFGSPSSSVTEAVSGITIRTDWGNGKLVSLNGEGMEMSLSIYLCPGVPFSFELYAGDVCLNDLLLSKGLSFVMGEIRSGFPVGESEFLHRFDLKNLSAEQRELIHQLIREHSDSKALLAM